MWCAQCGVETRDTTLRLSTLVQYARLLLAQRLFVPQLNSYLRVERKGRKAALEASRLDVSSISLVYAGVFGCMEKFPDEPMKLGGYGLI